MFKPVLLTLTILLSISLNAQNDEHEEPFYRHRIAPLMGYVFVPEETDLIDGSSFRLIPTFGIDYDFSFNRKWAIGWFNDIEASSYIIEYDDGKVEQLEREYLIISTICLIYTPVKHFTVYAGGGMEFERHQNFAVIRIGTEYEIPIRNNWDVAFGLSFDHKEVYNSYGFTVAFGKRF